MKHQSLLLMVLLVIGLHLAPMQAHVLTRAELDFIRLASESIFTEKAARGLADRLYVSFKKNISSLLFKPQLSSSATTSSTAFSEKQLEDDIRTAFPSKDSYNFLQSNELIIEKLVFIFYDTLRKSHVSIYPTPMQDQNVRTKIKRCVREKISALFMTHDANIQTMKEELIGLLQEFNVVGTPQTLSLWHSIIIKTLEDNYPESKRPMHTHKDSTYLDQKIRNYLKQERSIKEMRIFMFELATSLYFKQCAICYTEDSDVFTPCCLAWFHKDNCLRRTLTQYGRCPQCNTSLSYSSLS